MKSIIALFVFTFSILSYSQLKSPEEFLGYKIGTQFSRHADVIRYFEHVASNSNMVTYQGYGLTNERRPLTYAIVSSPNNINNIEIIRTNNLKQTGILSGNANPDIAIVWLSYNVHGNEASSTEAAMTTLYQLITEKKDWLENTVVIIDPCLNPDGRDRYANWYNQVKATPYDNTPIAIEHNEPWPGGRPNHYLFDLNRDWAWATQVESQQRLKIYNQWMPHIHVDFHEQGINEPYYFAPAAKPYHEIITPWQKDFQVAIGKNHAKYFDKEGWLFFTRQSFDLLYPSYGDTYPTFMGAIGMTYEQAGHGSAGLGIITDEGYELTLVDRVAHHTTTGLSTVEIASKNAPKLNEEFKKFFNNSSLTTKSYVLSGHPDKVEALAKLLESHEIQFGYIENTTVSGVSYSTGKNSSQNIKNGLVVSTQQPKGKMVKVLLEKDALLEEPLTYDITAWSLPYAYGLEAMASNTSINNNKTYNKTKTIHQVAPASTLAGYIVKWESLQDGKFLASLLQQGIKVRFTEKQITIQGKSFNPGSLIITKSDNRSNEKFTEIVTTTANAFERDLFIANTSFSDNGIDFGSYDVKLINPNKIGVLRGDGVSSLNYGAIWHFMEAQLKYPITSIDTGDLSAQSLAPFQVLVVPSGWYYKAINEGMLDDLKSWVRKGGKLICFENALQTFANKDGFALKFNENKEEEETKNENLIPYAQREREGVKNLITGSIYEVEIDNTHPLAFGYEDTYYSLKQGSDSFSFLENGYNVGVIKDQPISVAGFSGEEAKKSLENSLVFGEVPMGSGCVVYFVDDVLFRSFWENGKLFFVNSLFMVNSNVFILD